MRRHLLVPLAAAALLALAGCTAPADPEPTAGLLESHGLDGMDGPEIVEHLESIPVAERPTDLMASVRGDTLLLTDADGDDETTLDLPDDAFYLSVAPYVEQTHPCTFHSLTTCQGELGGQDVRVTVVDTATGETLVDEDTRLEDNGFVGYWLPRDVEAQVRVEAQGRTGQTVVTTAVDDPTCLTTVQLT
ncbi:CueP family metal-binding protein [Cellulosimicrobium marinum]|uniref:CueP family metal-binding protein n=1 Tax=Cellulosimicrobium marinum TaxID=1638992 RepID=UPI001E5B93B9|nr:CueP family metal-binding protein [Cellulosimicrobium marinum]MCB7137332.1 CueP family metal-binding protein [Cellulosimicrobium marinum]